MLNGHAYFVASSDKPVNYDYSENVNLPGAYIFPSSKNNHIQEVLSSPVQRFVDNIGYKNGLLCFELIDYCGKIYVIEAQFRYGGKFQEVFLRKEYGLDETTMLLSHALTGKIDGSGLPLTRPFKHSYALMNILLREGTIAAIPDTRTVMHFPNVDAYIPVRAIGTKIVPDGSMVQNFGKVSFSADTMEELLGSMRYFQEHIFIPDKDGSNMVIKSVPDSWC